MLLEQLVPFVVANGVLVIRTSPRTTVRYCRMVLTTDADSYLMPIAVLTVELRIEGAHSLKDKRQVLRSLKDKLRSSFNVSVAELDQTDLWQRATIGVVSISSSRDYLSGLMQQVERAANRIANENGAEVTDSFVELD